MQALATTIWGRDRLTRTMAEVMDYSERLMRAMLSDLPDGEGTFEDFLDGDGVDDKPDLDPDAGQEDAATGFGSASTAPTPR